MVILFLLLSFAHVAFAGEPIAAVAQKNFRIKNVRASLTNNTPSPEHNKRCWIALGLTTGVFAISAAFAATALTLYENTDLPAADTYGCTDANNRFVAHSPQAIACYTSQDPNLMICFFKDQLIELADQFTQVHLQIDYKK